MNELKKKMQKRFLSKKVMDGLVYKIYKYETNWKIKEHSSCNMNSIKNWSQSGFRRRILLHIRHLLHSDDRFCTENLGRRGYCVQRHFQQYFSYIVAISFIGGGNESTWRKPPTCHKSLTNFILNPKNSNYYL
jgi:hypothetical protein